MVRLVLLGFALLLGACGGGDDDDEGASKPLVCLQAGWECGSAIDLNGPIDCGSCPEGETCGLLTYNQCDRCEPRKCTDVGAVCGTIFDGCGGTVECGTCGDDETCGVWQANQCGACTPTTCEEQGAECGAVQDGCGNSLSCGTCAFGDCSWDNECVCYAARCEAADCGSKDDGCGGTVNCGECPTASTIRKIPLDARDLVADPARGKLYASVPSTAGAAGNSIAVIDTATATIERSFFVGSEPARVALSGDGRTLWVGLDGSASIAVVDLETDEVVETLVLTGSHSGDSLARAILVSPVDDGTILVAIGNGSFTSALSVFRNGNPVGTPATGSIGNAFAFHPDGGTLYEAGTFGDLTIRSVGPGGVSAGEVVRDVLNRNVGSMVVADGKLHCSNGRIFDLGTRSLVGTLQGAGHFDHESASARSYFVPVTLSSSFERPVISAFSSERFIPIDQIDLGLVDSYVHVKLVRRYADDGLAILAEGELWLVESTGL